MEDNHEDEELFGSQESMTNNVSGFMPMTLIYEWEDCESAMSRLSVAMLVPSGVSKGDFSVSVGDDDRSLVLRVNWPRPMIDIKVLYRR